MDWVALITTIIGALTGGGLMFFLNPRAAKKKPDLANKSTEANIESTAVSTMKDAIAEIRISNDNLIKLNERYESEMYKLNAELINLQKDFSLATTYICGNCGCSHRLPPSRGCGEQWLQQLKKGEVVPNYDPIRCTVINTCHECEE